MKAYLVEYRMGDPAGAVMTDTEWAFGEWEAVEKIRARWGNDGNRAIYIMSVRLAY
jgi:hypothetical protein